MLNVVVDTKPIITGLTEYARQIPFATSYAMNLTAKDCVTFMRSDIKRIFTIRNNWEAMGITFDPATKRDLRLTIGSRHDYMAAQVEGGKKLPATGGNVAIPQVGKGRPRALKKSTTPPSKWPKAIVTGNEDTTFIGTPKNRKGAPYGVYRRVERNVKSGKVAKAASSRTRAGLMLLYVLTPEVKIDKRWPMDQQVEQVWNGRWQANATTAISKVVESAYERY